MRNAEKSSVYDTVKVFTILLVVLAHATVMYTVNGAFHPANSSYGLTLLTTGIYKFHMPLFILIAGAVYGYCIQEGKYKNNLSFIKNKAARLLLPYFFWGLVYVAPVMELLGLDQSGYVSYCWHGIVLSHNARHLWYVMALFWIYLFAMLIKPLWQRNRWMVVLLSFILFLLYPHFPTLLQIYAAVRYQFYFVLGMLLNAQYDALRCRGKQLIAAVPVLLALLWLTAQQGLTILNGMCYALLGSGCMLAFAAACQKWFTGLADTRAYQIIKRDLFGIYLIHPMVIYVIYYALGQRDIPPVVLALGAAAVALFLSICGTEMIRSLHGNVLIGEKSSRKK